MLIYDFDTDEFIPLLTSGGLEVNEALHPLVLIRSDKLFEEECLGLDQCIRHIINFRAEAENAVFGIGRGNGGETRVEPGSSTSGPEVIAVDDDIDANDGIPVQGPEVITIEYWR